jgi:hypothetical protein
MCAKNVRLSEVLLEGGVSLPTWRFVGFNPYIVLYLLVVGGVPTTSPPLGGNVEKGPGL